MLVGLEIVNQVLKCEVPSLFFHRNDHGAESWRCGGSHGRSSLLQDEGVATHEVVELEDSAYELGDVSYPDCDCVWVSKWVVFVGSPVCSVLGPMLAVLVGKCRCMLTVALYVPRVQKFEALEKTILGHGCKEAGEVLVV